MRSAGQALNHARWRFSQQSLHPSRDCGRIAEHLGTTVTTHAGLGADIAGQVHRAGRTVGFPPAGLRRLAGA
ncbi:hypothetical protein [Streptomyces hainanensis]|uniref:Uncharacterized protein n=1 Tax=Streptomyces hainanensis TaxID=402648 RepID=A0A4R4TC05_9ACTN|nr:hypothetical protein [Streptomyces hainanensis]TDC74921.1 hypothetical protein E1283_14105 [Streptomyces hainanensis]